MDEFHVVDKWTDAQTYKDYKELHNAHVDDQNTYMQAALRRHYPELCLTATYQNNVPLLEYAAAGKATAELDTQTEDYERMRGYLVGNIENDVPNRLTDYQTFAKYTYSFGDDKYIVYIMVLRPIIYQYILKEPENDENTTSNSRAIDRLLQAVGDWTNDSKYVWVYDEYWTRSRALFDEVHQASWKDVILNEKTKRTLIDLVPKFFESKKTYHDLGVPWKRGVIFHGPAGNGKTISIKAMMNDLFQHVPRPIQSLYVKAAPETYELASVFSQARRLAPCMLIFEDIDTVVTPKTRSYFFNEVDGLSSNDGIFMVASTNHLDKLDPGLAGRPSRFDRKYLFDLPTLHERTMYCQYWKHKLQDKPNIAFPNEICPAVAGITQGFSFAYLKEAFVATLLVIAARRSEDDVDNVIPQGNLDRYELWRELKRQIAILRDDMETLVKAAKNGPFGSCVPQHEASDIAGALQDPWNFHG